MRLLIVGGVAGGASAATRARRLSEDVEITVFEKGPYVSYANCGLPYYIGNVIKEREKLLVTSPELLRKRFNIDVRMNSEVTAIDRQAKELVVRDPTTGQTYRKGYDKLILSPGADPIRPRIPGADLPRVFVLRNVPDTDAIKAAVDGGARRAVVIGGGYIGLEMAENLRARGLEVHVVEMLDHVLPQLDEGMANLVQDHLSAHGVQLHLGKAARGIREAQDGYVVQLPEGEEIGCDFVVMSVGVRPASRLAREAGLEIGATGGIKVDEGMRTSDPDIFAVGDAVEVKDFVTGQPVLIPLAGPANRQGRIAADNALGGSARYRGTQGTAVVRVFDLTVAFTGPTEKALQKAGIPYRSINVLPFNHASYYPGAAQMHFKLLFSPGDGRVLAAQIVGGEGVDKRIDVIATAIQSGMTVMDLEEAELAYAPQFGAAKDPVNMAGFVASNIIAGLSDTVTVPELDASTKPYVILDVRSDQEVSEGMIPGAIHIPIDQLRNRLSEVPADKEVLTHCRVGQRAYIASRILRNRGINAKFITGGQLTWRAYHAGGAAAGSPPAPKAPAGQGGGACCGGSSSNEPEAGSEEEGETHLLDVQGLQCPGPILRLSDRAASARPGTSLMVVATDASFPMEVRSWCCRTGHELVSLTAESGKYSAHIRIRAAQPAAPAAHAARSTDKTILVFSGDLDRVMAALVIATGAASMGDKVTLFFTFWGINALRRERPPKVQKGLLDRMFGMMMPRGARKLKLSKMNMAGVGTALMKHVMKTKNVNDLPTLLETALKSGVRVVACTMSMNVMGISKEELIDGIEFGGVAAYIDSANQSGINLFV